MLCLSKRLGWSACACLAGAILLFLWGTCCVSAAPDDLETYLPSEDWKQMDQFEAYALGRADKFFAQREYKQAEVEYNSFILEYPKSKAIPYALMRKGRTRHLVDKRYEAIKMYEEVLDYFPNEINYAAASLYYIGLAHQQNGNPVEAAKAFTEMAQDKDYRHHKLAARAIMSLADYLVKQDKAEAAVKYYEQVALDFRTRMPATSLQAMRNVIYHYVRRAPNEKALREFYAKARGFARSQLAAKNLKPEDQLLDDGPFTEAVRNYIREFGGFDPKAVPQRNAYYQYWVKVFENRHLGWDVFRLQISDWQWQYEQSREKWIQRADAQFQRAKPDFARIIWWMQNCWSYNYPEKIMEYYNLIDFSALNNDDIYRLMDVLYGSCRQGKLALNLFDKFNFAKMTEARKEQLASFLMLKNEGLFRRTLEQLKDQEKAEYLFLTLLVYNRDSKRGIPQADEVARLPQYADYALWEKSGFLMQERRYEEAIAVCRQLDRGAKAFYRIADCYVKLGKVDQAVQQLREIEQFFKSESARACLMIADLYGAVGRKKEQVAVLREVGRKYKKSPEASRAHVKLEDLGFATFDGTDAVAD